MNDRSNFDILEILAYVDGFLDGDPARKAELERRLASSPEEMARVRAFQAQNLALRRLGRERLDEPVPARLFEALEFRSTGRSRALARGAALVATIVLTTFSGWFLGKYHAQSQWSPRMSIEQAYRNALAVDTNPAPDGRTEQIRQTSTRGLSNRLSMIFRVPDLTKYGYAVVNTETMTSTGGQVARLTYESANGEEFSLFVRARWQEQDASMQVDNDGDVSVAFWLDGPLASAVVSRLPPNKTRAIAETVRKELRGQNVQTPVQQTPVQSVQIAPLEKKPGGTVTPAIESLPVPAPNTGDQTETQRRTQNQL